MKINISHKAGEEMVITNADTGEVLDIGYICWEKEKGNEAQVLMGVLVNEVKIENTDVTAEPQVTMMPSPPKDEQGLLTCK